MANDQTLWQGIVKGERAAFDALFRLYSAPLRLFLRRYTSCPDAADDVAQETFLQLWKRHNGFDPARGTLKQYLFGIARKQAAHRREEWPPPAPELATPAEPVWENATVAAKDQTADLNEALARLEAEERAMLWLREVEGYSYAEMSDILGVPLGTVKSKLFSARAALRQVWCNGRKG
jgi:RNA polymerase sigma-70 factor (ECF subfamily)